MPPTTDGRIAAEGADHLDSNGASADGRPYKKRDIIACTGCRTIKVKCRLPSGEAPTGVWEIDQSKCSRCVRLNIECQYKSAPRRGRRTLDTQSTTAPYEERQGDPSHITRQVQPGQAQPCDLTNLQAVAGPSHSISRSLSVHSAATAVVDRYPPPNWPLQQPIPARPSLSQAASSSGPPLLSGVTDAAQSSPALSAGMHQSPASQSSLSAEPRPSLSLAEAAEARSSTFLPAAKPVVEHRRPEKSSRLPDPVDLWLLSEAEARNLFSLWHERLNAYVILLDVHLHTFDYVRTQSSVLFTAILATAAKFFRPDLYQRLLAHAQSIIARAMGGDIEPDIGLLQGILLLVYWKEGMDSSAWMRVGYAIRLGYQLRLHRKRHEPLPANEHEARVLLDRERTWIVLVCFDNSYMLHDEEADVETRMITTYKIDIDAWLQETLPYGVHDDAEQGVSVGLLPVQFLCRAIATAPTKPAAQAVAIQAHELILTTYHKYFDGTLPGFTPLSGPALHKARIHVVAARFRLAEACLTASGLHDKVILADAIVQAGEMVASFEEAADTILLYVQDTIALMMLGFGEWIGRIFRHVGTSYQTTLVRYLTQVWRAATRAQTEHGGEAGGFIARFFRGALRALHPEGLPMTRPPSPGVSLGSSRAAGQANGENGVVQATCPFDQLNSIEPDIFTDLDSLFADLRNDTTYWDSLNPALATSTWAWLDEAFAPQGGGSQVVS
ncbi:hypothetical protein JCM10908_003202 [Rhodotorula pacifica]|uniref:uncharacterized protein n=1 Tax=Rhodotorula pacifica TaxID=1495444 RepID=UPI0031748BB3